jgi:hypothetical protein
VTASAKAGTGVLASSWAVRVTSRVRPMPPLASLRRSRRCRAQYSALMSKPQLATARTRPAASRTGHMLVAQAWAYVSPCARM